MSPRGKKIVDWNMSMGTAAKLAGIVVHAQEYSEGLESPSPDVHALEVDLAALRSNLYDSDVIAWIKKLGVIAPLRRDGR